MNTLLTAKTQPLIDYNGEQTLEPLEAMNPEEYLAWCARISSPDNRLNSETAPKLLQYLMDNKHWSPNEMVNFSFQIVTSRAIAQQLLRHRSFSFQEFSQRYARVNDFEPIELRLEHDTNRQSSTDITDDPVLRDIVNTALLTCEAVYDTLLDNGVAKECARMILPLTTQTTMVMNGTFRSWIHFLDQRCDEHVQKEIQLIALEIRKQLIPHMPWTAKALNW